MPISKTYHKGDKSEKSHEYQERHESHETQEVRSSREHEEPRTPIFDLRTFVGFEMPRPIQALDVMAEEVWRRGEELFQQSVERFNQDVYESMAWGGFEAPEPREIQNFETFDQIEDDAMVWRGFGFPETRENRLLSTEDYIVSTEDNFLVFSGRLDGQRRWENSEIYEGLSVSSEGESTELDKEAINKEIKIKKRELKVVQKKVTKLQKKRLFVSKNCERKAFKMPKQRSFHVRM